MNFSGPAPCLSRSPSVPALRTVVDAGAPERAPGSPRWPHMEVGRGPCMPDLAVDADTWQRAEAAARSLWADPDRLHLTALGGCSPHATFRVATAAGTAILERVDSFT